MQKKRCQFCGFPTEKGWSFCPQCGRALSDRGINISGVNIDLTKVVQDIMPKILNGVIDGSIFNNDVKSVKKEKVTHPAFTAKEIIEPEDLVSKHGDMVVHAINLPGVTDKSKIDINKMDNSIEIRAYDGERLYLKILRRDKKQSVISEEFANENLVLVLKKIN